MKVEIILEFYLEKFYRVVKGFAAIFSSTRNPEDASKKYAALLTVIHERIMNAKDIGDLYRVNKIMIWAFRDRDFQYLLYKNELLRHTYNECLNFYNYIDFVDLKNPTNISQRKVGLYANMVLTCIQRFPCPANEIYMETVRTNYAKFTSLALK
jgi:hypothetical protein